jgi:hypothetical protein
MAPVSIPPIDEAREVFRRLGYEVSGDGTDLRARRKWRTVDVRVLSGDEGTVARQPMADGGQQTTDYRCFVTWSGAAPSLRDRLAGRDLGYQWAVIGVDREGDHEVVHAPSAGR